MTHTPRTDNEYQLGFNNQRYVRVDFARQLEREIRQCHVVFTAELEAMQRQLAQARAPAAPGMVMVPVAPTEAMLDDGIANFKRNCGDYNSLATKLTLVYRAMLKAAAPGAGRKP